MQAYRSEDFFSIEHTVTPGHNKKYALCCHWDNECIPTIDYKMFDINSDDHHCTNNWNGDTCMYLESKVEPAQYSKLKAYPIHSEPRWLKNALSTSQEWTYKKSKYRFPRNIFFGWDSISDKLFVVRRLNVPEGESISE